VQIVPQGNLVNDGERKRISSEECTLDKAAIKLWGGRVGGGGGLPKIVIIWTAHPSLIVTPGRSDAPLGSTASRRTFIQSAWWSCSQLVPPL
jgi:hypothetical protein